MKTRNFRRYRFDTVDSTNACAIRAAEQGEPEVALFIADAQTAGRGRLGRTWESPPGKNLYLSFLFRPTLPPAKLPELTRVAAEALVETLAPFVPTGLLIKWPNDLLLNGKKLAGILCETRSAGEKGWVVCGIGLNVNLEDFPEELRNQATSLKLTLGREFDREVILERLISQMLDHYGRYGGGMP